MERFHASVEAARRGRNHRRTATGATTSPSSPDQPATRSRRCWSGSRKPSSASRPFRHLGAPERRGKRDPRVDRAPRHVRVGRGGLGANERTRRRQGSRSHPFDGVPSYYAADAAYIRRKYARGFDRLIYVLGADHHGYVARLQALAEMLGEERDSLEVLIYQLVHLAEGGEAKKMSKRRGDVAFLDDLLDTIGGRSSGTSSPGAMTRRSSSTSTWRSSGRRRTPSTTCTHAASRASSETRAKSALWL